LTRRQPIRDNLPRPQDALFYAPALANRIERIPSMTEHQIDSSSVRTELRTLPRGSLLIIAERAIELVPTDQLTALLADIVHLDADTSETTVPAPLTPRLLDEVREFHDAAMAGHYHQAIEVSSMRGFEQSPSTDSFIADFDRLTRKCIGAVGQGENSSGVRESFELLFGLLRYIDEGNDDVLFFADDGSSSDVGVNWHVVLPAYFNCLAKTSSPEEFARTVNETIADFVSYDQPSYMNTAANVASDEQRVALDAFVVTGK